MEYLYIYVYISLCYSIINFRDQYFFRMIALPKKLNIDLILQDSQAFDHGIVKRFVFQGRSWIDHFDRRTPGRNWRHNFTPGICLFGIKGWEKINPKSLHVYLYLHYLGFV